VGPASLSLRLTQWSTGGRESLEVFGGRGPSEKAREPGLGERRRAGLGRRLLQRGPVVMVRCDGRHEAAGGGALQVSESVCELSDPVWSLSWRVSAFLRGVWNDGTSGAASDLASEWPLAASWRPLAVSRRSAPQRHSTPQALLACLLTDPCCLHRLTSSTPSQQDQDASWWLCGRRRRGERALPPSRIRVECSRDDRGTTGVPGRLQRCSRGITPGATGHGGCWVSGKRTSDLGWMGQGALTWCSPEQDGACRHHRAGPAERVHGG
jgi:hypothetical protein